MSVLLYPVYHDCSLCILLLHNHITLTFSLSFMDYIDECSVWPSPVSILLPLLTGGDGRERGHLLRAHRPVQDHECATRNPPGL